MFHSNDACCIRQHFGVKKMKDYNALASLAIMAREKAYAPYSNFLVGAALLCDDGTVYSGCNIENAAYSPTNCAERTAVFKAVSEGKRIFTAIAICAGKQGEHLQPVTPCGVCRQVLREFANDDFEIICALSDDNYTVTTLGALFPNSFGPQDL